MKFSSLDSDTILSNIRENRQAEPSSARSDPPKLISLRCQFTRPWEALALIAISLEYKYWETDVLIRTIAHRAYANNYEGRWRTVQEILETELQSSDDFVAEFCKHFSPEEYYGNLLPLTLKMRKRIMEKDITKTPNSKVNKPQRKRGYADKGSRRLPHEYHGDVPEKLEREDRRKNITHPLIGVQIKFLE